MEDLIKEQNQLLKIMDNQQKKAIISIKDIDYSKVDKEKIKKIHGW